MSAASAPPWPGSRVVLGWWRQLSGRQPRQLWISHLLIHGLEALVRVRRAQPLDPWQRAFLHLLDARTGSNPKSAFDDLQMDRQILARLLRQLMDTGLVRTNGSGAWELTAAGRQALAAGSLSASEEERRSFCFVDNADLHRPSYYLSILSPLPIGATPRGALTQPRSALSALETCLQQTSEWKVRHHFPADVEELLLPRPDADPATSWRRVVLDSPHWLPFVFIRPASPVGAAHLLGFAVQSEGWILERDPGLRLAEGWQEALPDLAEEPDGEAWRQSWQAWSHPRGLPSGEVNACRLERAEHRLLVRAPPRLIDRLRVARSDAVKSESWLLAGDGRTRTAAQIELLPLEGSK